MSDDVVPRIAFKTHLDGDPNPRPGEVVEMNRVRESVGIETFIFAVVVDDPTAVEQTAAQPFVGRRTTWYEIGRRDGEIYCEPTEIAVQIVP